MKNKLPTYDNYKHSNVEWLGEIPQHWEVKKLKDICQINRKSLPENTNKNFSFEYVDIGSVNFEKGVTNTETFIFKNAPSRARRIAEIGDTIISTVRTYLKAIDYIGDSKDKYIYSTGFAILTPKETHSKYLSMAVKSDSFTNQVDIFSTGMSYPAINSTELGRLKIAIPPLSEQEKIAQFLDEKTTKIDKAIEIKERQIELLKERRQILIHRAVTRGLDVNVPLKDSGIEWIGEIPEHWEVKKTKFLFDEINERSKTGAEELLSVSHLTGVTPRSEKNVTMFQSEDYTDSKLCKKGDLVFNIMWAWMGALGVSDRTGIVSPSYAIYRQKNKDFFNMKYVEHLLSSINYIEHYNRVSTGLHSSRLRFYSNMFFDMKIGFPPQEEQNKIIEYIENISAKISKAIGLKEREIEKLKEYKSSLINSAVTGKVKIG